jgi:hypothetical protein
VLGKAIFQEGWGAGLGPHWGHASNADIPAGAVLDPSDQPEKREQYDRGDNRSDQAVNSDAEQAEYPATDQGADNPDNDVANKAKAASAHDLPGNPTGNSADHQENY